MIELDQINKSYGPNKVLFDVNLKLEKGKIYGLVGENGSGKTTLFKCIAGLENYEGLVRSEMMPVKNYLGYLPTEPYFLPKLTGREYLILMCSARKKTCGDLDKKNIFNLPLDKYAAQYSTGMKKKLALLAVLLQGNDFFILDEPFNGVDIHSNIMINDLILELKKLEKTILVSSHIFKTLTDICDEIFMLREGKISNSYQEGDFKLLENEMLEMGGKSHIEALGLT